MYQLPLFTPDSDWCPPSFLPDKLEGKVIAFDLETRDPDLKTNGPGWATNNGEVIGISLASENFTGYLPIAHREGGNMNPELVKKWVRQVLSNEDQIKLGFNVTYDLGWLRTLNIDVKGKVYDNMFVEALLNENRRGYNLNYVAKVRLNDSKDETLMEEAAAAWGLKDTKGEMWKLPAMYVGPYAEQDAALLLKLWEVQKPLLDQDNLWNIFELECNLIPMIIEMRARGVRVDLDKADILKKKWKNEEDIHRKRVKEICGFDIDIWSSASLAKAFDKLGYEYNKTAKGNPEFQGEWLEAHESELAKTIIKVRKNNRAWSTFIDGMILSHAHNGRIHCSFNQLKSDEGGTVSGRFSSSNPNLQQVPARDPEFGPAIRSLFLPEEGDFWAACDYSQQEPRLTVHFAAMAKVTGWEKAVNYYSDNPDADFHQMVADLANIPRKQAKTINLGLAYGMGQLKLCKSLGLETKIVKSRDGRSIEVAGDEAKEIFEKYHTNAPFIRALTDTCDERASRRGWIKTLEGRTCHFNSYEPVDRDIVDKKGWTAPDELWIMKKKYGNNIRYKRAYTYKAMNRLIQGSAADQNKRAMLHLYQEGIIPLVIVHDENGISCTTHSDAKKAGEIMRDACKLHVPVKVDIEIGPNWGEANQLLKL